MMELYRNLAWVDVYEDDEVLLLVDVPGVEQDGLDIWMVANSLSLYLRPLDTVAAVWRLVAISAWSHLA